MYDGKWAMVGQGGCSVARLALLLLGMSPAALAQEMGARSLGAGLTGRADGGDSGAAGLNVAAVSLAPTYDVVAGIGFGPNKLFMQRAFAMDSRTSMVTMGAGYYHEADVTVLSGSDLPGWKTPEDELLNPTDHQGVGIAFAYPFLSRRMSVGATARYDWRVGERTGKQSDFNFGVTAAGRPIDTLTLALGFRNALLLGYPDSQRELDAAVRWAPGPFLGLEMDGVVPVEKEVEWSGARLGSGAEVGIAALLAIRAGWSTSAGQHDLTAGLGLSSEHAALDYGIRIGLGDVQLWHAVDLKVMF